MSVRLGAHTGDGLVAVIREQFPVRIGRVAVVCLFVVNLGLVGRSSLGSAPPSSCSRCPAPSGKPPVFVGPFTTLIVITRLCCSRRPACNHRHARTTAGRIGTRCVRGSVSTIGVRGGVRRTRKSECRVCLVSLGARAAFVRGGTGRPPCLARDLGIGVSTVDHRTGVVPSRADGHRAHQGGCSRRHCSAACAVCGPRRVHTGAAL
jgi:hypothetical protein